MMLNGSARRQRAPAHICCLLHDDDEHGDVLSAFVRAGLEAAERVVYLAHPFDDVQERLPRLGVTVTDRAGDKLVVQSALETYCPSAYFEADEMLEQLRRLYDRAHSEGHSGARILAEMTWALERLPDCDRLVDCESRIDALLATHPMIVMCQYDMRRFDAATAFAMLGCHPQVVIGGRVVPNPY